MIVAIIILVTIFAIVFAMEMDEKKRDKAMLEMELEVARESIAQLENAIDKKNAKIEELESSLSNLWN